MKNIFIVSILSFLLFNCVSESLKKGTNSSQNIETELILVKKISIPIDTLPYNFSFSSIYNKEDTLYFIGLDKSTNALYFYSITDQKFSHKIQKPIEGNQKFKIKDFYIHSEDSIFLLDDYGFKAQLVNNKGKTLENYNLEKVKESAQVAYIMASNNKRLKYLSNDTFLLSTYPDYAYHEKEFYDNGFSTLISLDKTKSVKTIGSYPKFYATNEEGYFSLAASPTILYHKNNFLVNFTNDHSIFKIEDDSLLQIDSWKSNYLNDFERLPVNSDDQQQSNYVFTNGFYLSLLSDKETETLYRIVKHSQPLKNAEGKLNQYLECGFSIMYGKLDDPNPKEVLLEKGKYVPYVVHSIGNNQLLISLENPFNPKNKENMLEFEIIELK